MTSTAAVVWTQYAICVLMIGVAGVKLTDYGDAIADKTGMGGSWVGLVLIATVTSLPELAAGVTASAVALLPDIAAGDVLGSCVYNLVLLAVLDLFYRRGPLLAQAQRQHVMSAAFGAALIGIGAIGLLTGRAGVSGLTGHVAWTSPILVLIYAAAIRTMHRYQEDSVGDFTEQKPDRYAGQSVRAIGTRYAAAAAVVVAAGVWLPYVSEDLSLVMGWNQSFTGTLFTALSTSLPELVVTLAALRLGAINLAIGNVLGSNMFNMLVLAIDDFVYVQGPLFAAVSEAHIISAVAAMTMSAIVIIAVFVKPRVRVLGIGGWGSLALFTLFAVNTWLLYRMDAGAH
ncbi:MAG: sodium:calcium antiporter [Thiohalocapsa sp.]|jgi:cation:H+ antiporter